MIPPRLRLPLLLASWLALPSFACAHQLDEYLQSTLVVIAPVAIRLQIILTPGVSVADQVITLMDRDTDGIISLNESVAYADLLKHDITAHLDARDLALNLTATEIPTPAELRTGAGIIQIEFTATPGPLASGPHTLTLQNHHFPSASVYLINAAKPRADTILITQQKRNEKQSSGEIAFTFQPPANPSPSAGPVSVLGALLFALIVGACWMVRQRRVHPTRCT